MPPVHLAIFVLFLCSALSARACPVYNERRSDDLKADDGSDGTVKGALKYLENLDKFYSNAARPRFGKKAVLPPLPILNLWPWANEYQRHLPVVKSHRT